MPSQKAAKAKTNGHAPVDPDAVRLRFPPSVAERYQDIEIYCRLGLDDTPLDDYLALVRPLDSDDPDFWAKFAERYRAFAREALVSWNLKDRHGEAIPPTEDGMLKVGRHTAQDILDAFWETRVTPEDGDPKDSPPSSSGSTSG